MKGDTVTDSRRGPRFPQKVYRVTWTQNGYSDSRTNYKKDTAEYWFERRKADPRCENVQMFTGTISWEETP